MSIDIGSDVAGTITFTGTVFGGGTVTQTFDVEDTDGSLQRLTFNGGFTDLVSVQWTPGATLTDNITVTRPQTLWAGMSGSESLAGVVEMDSIRGLPSVANSGLDVSVRNIAPTLSLSADGHVQEGSTYTLTIGRPSDPGSDTVGRYLVHWGDGTPAETVEVPPDPEISYTAARGVQHVYADDGDYTITVEIVDEDGTHSLDLTSGVQVAVDNVAPAVDAGTDRTADEGGAFAFAGSVSDPGANTHTFLWDFGDGSTSTDPNPAHAYADNGAYTVILTVTDDRGASRSDTLTVTVNNVAPTADAGPDQAVDKGEPVTLSGSFTDPGSADTHAFRWHLLSATNGEVIGDAETREFTFMPADAGVYVFAFTVTDDDGGSATETVTINVREGDVPAPLTANQRFVIHLYSHVLYRPADPSGLAAWSGLLDQGKATPTQVADQFMHSLEYRQLTVRELYRQFLGRDAEPFGMTVWVGFLAAGGTCEQLKAHILGSPEYYVRAGGTTIGFVTALYGDALGRTPDPSELMNWAGAVNRGFLRRFVAEAVLRSQESDLREVDAMYREHLYRAPDAGGCSGFTGALQDGLPNEMALAVILGSEEFMSQA
jgi:PKD repeat protein